MHDWRHSLRKLPFNHLSSKTNTHLGRLEQVFQAGAQVLADHAVGLVREHHVHGPVHGHREPRRRAAVHARQVRLQPLQDICVDRLRF